MLSVTNTPIMLSVIMMSVVMMSVIMLSVIMLSVVMAVARGLNYKSCKESEHLHKTFTETFLWSYLIKQCNTKLTGLSISDTSDKNWFRASAKCQLFEWFSTERRGAVEKSPLQKVCFETLALIDNSFPDSANLINLFLDEINGDFFGKLDRFKAANNFFPVHSNSLAYRKDWVKLL